MNLALEFLSCFILGFVAAFLATAVVLVVSRGRDVKDPEAERAIRRLISETQAPRSW